MRGEIEDVYKVSTDNTNIYLFTSYVGLLWLTTGRPRAWRRVSVSGGCFCDVCCGDGLVSTRMLSDAASDPAPRCNRANNVMTSEGAKELSSADARGTRSSTRGPTTFSFKYLATRQSSKRLRQHVLT